MIDQESPQERQKQEFEVLKSMYPNELIDLRKTTAKNKWKPLNLSLTLLPSQGNDPTEVYAKVNLRISCCNKYPEVAPKIELNENGGLTKEELSILQNELEELAQSKIGEVMIFNLAEHVETYLDLHRKPLSKSCYDEMVTRQKRKEEEERVALEQEMDRERKVLQKEIQEREEMSKIEISNQTLHETSSCEEDTFNFKRNSIVESCCCDADAPKIVEFLIVPRIIQKGKCLRHISSSLVSFTSIDKQTGEILLMYEWKIAKKEDFSTLVKLIAAAEQEFTFLVKLKHLNLVHYLNLKCDYSDHDDIKIYLLREFAYGLNCQELYLNNKISVGVDMLRYIAADVLTALDYLHQNNVVHKEIGASSIYLTKTNVKLANFSLYKRFTDITLSNHQTNYNKRTDIYRFGLLLLSLLKGDEIDEVVHIPESISTDLYDFLIKCVGNNEKERFTTQQLLEHPFIKLPIEKFCLETNLNFSPNHLPPLTSEQQLAELQSFKTNANLQSRVQTEFEVLHTIGKGAFGEVFKVRNKLDQRFYAIKRMVLNPKKKQGNKKIIQEVKTLSRLNHEHVVRYFNSWIETTVVENDDVFTSTDTSRATPFEKKLVIREKTDSFLEKLNDYNHKEWSISFKPKSSNRKSSISSSSSESLSLFESDSSDDSDSVEFEREENNVNSEEDKSQKNENKDTFDSFDTVDTFNRKQTREIQYMYIQMEFCEKSTLRTAIDAGLYGDKDRVWRLFREIVDGLIYIHQQGMIHRDLKPVNIFLNKNDHVKIGDFGLATPSLLPKTNELASINASGTEYGVDKVDKSLTGHIGTVLYVAPEIDAVKPSYNQRVDTYSLGIIFFEMSYRPIKTGMERIFILTKLRTKEIEFPEDFLKFSSTSAENIIKLLLNHNGNERPSSLELKEKYIPSPTEKYNVILEHVKNALSNTNSKIYKDFMSLCLQQNITNAQDILYDRDPSIWNIFKHRKLYDFVRKSIIKAFKLHGGQNIPTPLLLPKSKFYEHVDSCVSLMTKNGTIVSIPHDLRVPFARYLAWNEISILRRYSIERVYREKKELDRIPRELYECAFDIVTPSRGNFVLDAELFSIFKEIVDNLLGVNTKKCTIRLNHPLLVKAILLQCNIKDRHSEVFNILSFSDLKDCQGKSRLQIHLTSLGISDTSIMMLFKLLETEVSADKIDSHFQMLTRKKSTEIGINSKKALGELKSIIQNVESFGVDYNIIIVPNLLFKIQQYSGVMFQIGCQLRKKHSKGMDILAAGGRYDSMITEYRSILEKANLTNLEIQQTAVGISISLDKMVQVLIKHQAELDEIDDTNQFEVKCDQIVSVLCLGSINNKEKTRLMTDLWTNGIKSSLIEGINEEFAEELKVPILIIFKDTEQGVVSIRYNEKDRVQNKRIKRTDLIDFIQQLKNSCYQQRIDHNRTTSERNDQQYSNNDLSVNISFVTSEKISGGSRRKYENQILTQLQSFTERFNGEIIVLVLTLDLNIIRTLSSYLDFENDYQFKCSVKTIIERHQQNRKYLNEVCDEIRKIKFKKTQPIIILYSLQESVYKVIF